MTMQNVVNPTFWERKSEYRTDVLPVWHCSRNGYELCRLGTDTINSDIHALRFFLEIHTDVGKDTDDRKLRQAVQGIAQKSAFENPQYNLKKKVRLT